MKPDLMLHIGLPKTGTTSIQYVLGMQRAALLQRGVFYPLSPGKSNHVLLPASIIDLDTHARHFHPTVWEGLQPAARVARFRQEFVEEFSAMPAPATRVLISAEHCGAFLRTRPLVEAVRDMLAPYVGRIQVIVYLRRQDLFEASIQNEYLRVGTLRTPQLQSPRDCDYWNLDYLTILDLWASVFGEDAIVVRVFEPGAMRHGNVIDDFLAACGIDLPIAPGEKSRALNRSMSLAGQFLMQRIGQHLVDTRGAAALQGNLWRHVGNACDSLSGDGWLPTRGDALAFMAHFAEDNETVRRRFRPDRATLFSEDYDRLPETPLTLDESSLLVAAMDALVFAVERGADIQAIGFMREAKLHRQLGDNAARKSCLQQAIWLNPALVPARMALADELLREGDLSGAREHAIAVQQLDPESAQARDLRRRIDARERTAPHPPRRDAEPP